MYSVHTQYILSTWLCPLHSDVTVLLLCLLLSTNSVNTWYGTVLHWYTTCYSTEPLVLLCTGTYLLAMHVTILRISSFRFGTQYIQICTSLIAKKICKLHIFLESCFAYCFTYFAYLSAYSAYEQGVFVNSAYCHIAIWSYFLAYFLAYSGINQAQNGFNLLLKHLAWPAWATSGH